MFYDSRLRVYTLNLVYLRVPKTRIDGYTEKGLRLHPRTKHFRPALADQKMNPVKRFSEADMSSFM